MTVSNPSDLLAAIYGDLSRWAQARKGVVHVARDLEQALSLAASATPGGFSLVLHWQGDDPAGTNPLHGNVAENNIRVFVQANLGPTAKPDIALIQATAARPNPFLGLVGDVRRRMLGYRFPGVDAPGNRMRYKGTSDQTAVGGYLVAVYSILFGIWTVMDLPEDDDVIELAIAGA